MNSAQRLRDLCATFDNIDPSHNMQQAWEIATNSKQTGDTELTSIFCIATMREVTLLVIRLEEIGAPQSAYSEAASQLKAAFSPTQLSTRWAVHRDGMRARATPLALEWASWALGKFNEPDLDHLALEELNKGIEAQDILLRDRNLPANLRHMLMAQVADLRAALALYKIQGRQPLYDAINRQAGEIRHATPEIFEEAQSTPAAKAASDAAIDILKKAGSIAENGSKIMKFTKDAAEYGALGWTALKAIGKASGYTP
ncbi:hypothetical protein GN316_06705 [Xylophilus sp. Kf1]|nr:hypothetical protein [Xylophilus sp. Kf1]